MPRAGFRIFYPRTPRHYTKRHQAQVDNTRIINGVVRIPLSRGKVTLLDKSDYPRVRDYTWHAEPSGSKTFYARSSIIWNDGKRGNIRLHRLLLGLNSDSWTDHIDGNGLDNRRRNLRPCNPIQNSANRHGGGRGTSQFRGVYWARLQEKWVARIVAYGTPRHLGCFISEEQAARVYDQHALEVFGEFAELNFPETRTC